MQYITLLILVTYIFFHIREKNVIRPDYIYTIVMLGSLYITGLQLSAYQSKYEWWFYACIYGSVILFCTSYSIAKKYKKNEKLKIQIRKSAAFVYDADGMKKTIIFLWLIVEGAVLIMWSVLGAPPAISLTSERSSYYISGIGTLYLLNTALFALIVFGYFQKNKCISKYSFLLFIGTTVLSVFLMANKFQIFTLAIAFFTIISILKKEQSFKSILMLSVAAILLFAVMYEFVYSEMYSFSSADAVYWYKISLPNQLRFLAQPYLYIANNLENLYHFMSIEHHNTRGYNLMYNATRNMDLCKKIFGSQIVGFSNEFADSLQMKSMNTGSALMASYQDFGFLGIFAYSILIGAISGLAEKNLIKKRNFMSVFMYSYVIISLFLSFLSENFFSKPLLINLLVVWLLSPFINGRYHVFFGKFEKHSLKNSNQVH